MIAKKFKDYYIVEFKDMIDYIDKDTCFVTDEKLLDGNIFWHGIYDECKDYIENIADTMPKCEEDLEGFYDIIYKEVQEHIKDTKEIMKQIVDCKNDLKKIGKILLERPDNSDIISKKIFYTALRFESLFKNWKYTKKRGLSNKQKIDTKVSLDLYDKQHPCPTEVYITLSEDEEFFTINLNDFNFSEIPDNRLLKFLDMNFHNMTVFLCKWSKDKKEYVLYDGALEDVKRGMICSHISLDIIKGNSINSVCEQAHTRNGFEPTPRLTYINRFTRSIKDGRYTLSDIKYFINERDFATIEELNKALHFKNWEKYVSDAILQLDSKIPPEDLEEEVKKESFLSKIFKRRKSA